MGSFMTDSRPISPPNAALAASEQPTSDPGRPRASQNSLAAVNPRVCPACGARYPADFRVCPRDATPLEDAPSDEDPLVGQLFDGNYEVVRVIGEGGMGRVYEARHTRLHTKRFAVKLLHHELAREPEVVTRFQREAEAASVLTHPNVVGVFDVNTSADGRPYIVAELLEGEELGKYLERLGKLPVAEAVHIVRQVCHALGAAHTAGIVHRDVKPENVFLAGPNATVKVLDFGISKVAEFSDGLTKTGTVMGTPDYMAPEQARGDRVDARADIYAVGAILYRALTGRKPFDGQDPMAILTAVLTQEPERPSTLEASIPLSLELIVQRTMAKSPNERFSSMDALEQGARAVRFSRRSSPRAHRCSLACLFEGTALVAVRRSRSHLARHTLSRLGARCAGRDGAERALGASRAGVLHRARAVLGFRERGRRGRGTRALGPWHRPQHC